MDSQYFLSYLCLIFVAAVMAVLGYANWRRFGGLEHIVLPVVLYYYSLFGAWKILRIKDTGAISDALDHLERSLTTVQINDDYVLTLLVYGTFNIMVLLGVWASFIPSWRSGTVSVSKRVFELSEVRVVTIAFGALVLSVLSLQSEITEALQSGASVYLFTRSEGGRWFTIHQLLNRVGLASLACAWPCILLAKKRSAIGLFALVFCSAIWIGYLGLLGNRNEIAVAVLGGIFFYALLGGRITFSRLLPLAFMAYVVLRAIEYLRANPTEGYATILWQAILTPDFWDPTKLASGSESMAAHLSLYGVLSRELPFTFGSSFLYLVQSLIPLYPSGSRVSDSYEIYSRALGAPEEQGFNIHFAAGAYLNGGLLGVFVSALLLLGLISLVKTVCSKAYCTERFRSAGLFAYSMFFALVPIAMRGGPEGLKGLFFEGFGIPFLVGLMGAAQVSMQADCGGKKMLEQRA